MMNLSPAKKNGPVGRESESHSLHFHAAADNTPNFFWSVAFMQQFVAAGGIRLIVPQRP
jgi:hypothetical protein